MTEQTIFNEDGTPQKQEEGAPSGEVVTPKPAISLPDNVKDLVGDGKKYASVEKALEALGHSQEHIARIEAENAELRGKMQGGLSTEEVYAAVQELLEKEKGKTSQPPSLDEAGIASLLDRKLAEREAATVKARNIDTVKKALRDKFGDKAEEAYINKAKELGIGVNFLNSLAEASAPAALEYFGLKPGAAASINKTTSSVNTAALSAAQKPNDPPPRIMQGATTQDMTAAWQRAKKNLGYDS